MEERNNDHPIVDLEKNEEFVKDSTVPRRSGSGSMRVLENSTMNRIPFQSSQDESETHQIQGTNIDEQEESTLKGPLPSENSLTTPTASIKPGAPQMARKTFRNL